MTRGHLKRVPLDRRALNRMTDPGEGQVKLYEVRSRGKRQRPAKPIYAALATAVLALIGVSGTACSSGATSSADQVKAQAAAPSASAYVARAKEITREAETGLVYSPTDWYTPPGELKPMTSWLGPTTSPALPAGKSIAFVSCGAVVCNQAAEEGAQVAHEVGFKTSLVNINGAGDIQNLNQAMSSAIALHPSAIVGVCVTATQVSAELQQARTAGIVTVSTCDPTPTNGSGEDDAAADWANGLSAELLGWAVVANTEGHANVVAITDKAYPSVVRKIDNLVQVLQGCSTCTVKTVTWETSEAENSAQAASIVTGIINSNPGINTFVMPYSIGMPSVVQAVNSSGRDIKIYSDDADPVNLPLLHQGALQMVSAVDPELVMYQAIDQVIRGLNKSPYIQPANLPYVAHLYTTDTAPANESGAFLKFFDYAAAYDKMWGLK